MLGASFCEIETNAETGSKELVTLVTSNGKLLTGLIDLIPLTEQAGVADKLGGGLFNLIRKLTAEAAAQ